MNTLKEILSFNDEGSVFDKFERAAHYLLHNWQIHYRDELFNILEFEFFLHCDRMDHRDMYVSKSPVQELFGHWYFNRGSVDLTFGSPGCYASIQLRSIQHVHTGEFCNGPQRVFRRLFEDGGDATSFSVTPQLVLNTAPKDVPVIASPRVGLNFTEFSDQLDERFDFLLRPYRFTREDAPDMVDKYVALLFVEKVSGVRANWNYEEAIYKKYLKAYDLGYQSNHPEIIWKENSKTLRLARMMGYMHRKGEVLEPVISNEIVGRRA